MSPVKWLARLMPEQHHICFGHLANNAIGIGQRSQEVMLPESKHGNVEQIVIDDDQFTIGSNVNVSHKYCDFVLQASAPFLDGRSSISMAGGGVNVITYTTVRLP